MRRLPPWPTLIVALAVAAMIALGLWQLRRAQWKEGLIARWATAQALPPVAFPAVPPPDDALLYRRATGWCLQPTGFSARAGESLDGRPGWRHIARCRTGGAEGPGMTVDVGWSTSSASPKGWRGGAVTGTIGRDRDTRIILVAEAPAPGLSASARPDPADEPNNHRAYAVQWFVFAGIAALIYALALRGRRGAGAPPPAS